MKILCFLLSVYVILLSTKPCCADYDCQAKIAGNKVLSQKTPVKEKECPGCSPFFTCGACVGFIVSKTFKLYFPSAIEINAPKFAVYHQPDIPKVALSIWLPPKIS